MFNKENLENVLREIESGNNFGEKITLVGATKTISVDVINMAIENGLTVVAENRVQEFLQKTDLIKSARQHFIGHLQTNKVKYLVGKVDLIHSVDSLNLANVINERAKKTGCIQDILIEVNIGGELSKSGFNKDNALDSVKAVSEFSNVNVRGFMAMLPKTDDRALQAILTRQMRELFDEVKKKKKDFDILSVGMSADYKVAIENGSNMIRLGSVIFGERIYNN